MASQYYDKLSKPASGHYFALSFGESVTKLGNMSFDKHDRAQRLSVLLLNSDIQTPCGFQVATFLPHTYIALFSMPQTIVKAKAVEILDAALKEFHKIDASSSPSVREQQFVVYRALFSSPETLTVTEHVMSGTSRKYLQFKAAAALSNTNKDLSSQRILGEKKIA